MMAGHCRDLHLGTVPRRDLPRILQGFPACVRAICSKYTSFPRCFVVVAVFYALFYLNRRQRHIPAPNISGNVSLIALRMPITTSK
jgi:hypothetical protein